MRDPEIAGKGSGDEARWRAVLARDPRYDGAFLYAVRSTGIYCRPVCPSRRPARAKVEFYEGPEAAERAGFRACRRCRPGEARPDAPEAALVNAVCRALEAAAEAGEETPGLAELGKRLGMSPQRLQRTFKRALGVTPRAYAAARRWRRFKDGLQGGGSVTGALYDAGYGSPSRVYERAGERLGMTPAVYGRGGRGMRIGYRLVSSPLGRVLVAATARGVCAVSLGGSDAELVRELEREYPQAEIRPGAVRLDAWVRPLLRRMRGLEDRTEIPLDVRATAFQWRVWQALRAIPPGSTRSYGELARDLGHPTAARAVARACATNPVALVIPCHRAVGAGGALTGYRWGLERKRGLLERERAAQERGRALRKVRRAPSSAARRPS